MSARLAVIALLVVAGCATGISTPTPPASRAPSAPAASATPAATPTATPTLPSDDPARLVVTGYGACGGPVVIFYGGCRPLLLLAATHTADFSDWELDDALPFETGPRGESEIPLTGSLESGPTTLAPGRWTVGLGVWEVSDDLNEPESLAVLCHIPFTVYQARSWSRSAHILSNPAGSTSFRTVFRSTRTGAVESTRRPNGEYHSNPSLRGR